MYTKVKFTKIQKSWFNLWLSAGGAIEFEITTVCIQSTRQTSARCQDVWKMDNPKK